MSILQPESTGDTPDPGIQAPPRALHFKVPYGIDTGSKLGFYWPSSKQKRGETLFTYRNEPAIFESTYQCRPGAREGSIFLSSDIDCFFKAPPDLHLGSKNSFNARMLCARSAGVFQAWDTASEISKQSAYTVCVTGMFVPCVDYHRGESPDIYGVCDPHFDVYILDVYREKIDWGGLTAAFRSQFVKWSPEAVIIENRSSGMQLIQSLSHTTFPIIAVKTIESKGRRAVESVGSRSTGSVQGWFRQHRVRLPDNVPQWYGPWRAEMKDFSGDGDSYADQVDATVHLVSHAIMRGATTAVLPSDWTPDFSTGPAFSSSSALYPSDTPDQRLEILSFIGQAPLLTTDPFAGTCSHCVSFNRGFCSKHQRRVIGLDTCESFTDAVENKDFMVGETNRNFADIQKD